MFIFIFTIFDIFEHFLGREGVAETKVTTICGWSVQQCSTCLRDWPAHYNL